MRIRGRRECRDCGHRWSYYETGSVTCPSCGGVESSGLDERRRLHTASPAALDLSEVRADVEDRPIEELTADAEIEEPTADATIEGPAADAKDRCRAYRREHGFVRGGELLELSETYLAAAELAHVADAVDRRSRLRDGERAYLLALLSGADLGDRPEPEAVPESLRAARGLAVAEAVGDYRRELLRWLGEHPDPEARAVLGEVAEHAKRLRALEGDVPPAVAEELVAAVGAVGGVLRGEEGASLAAARERLDDLAGRDRW